MTTRNKFQPEDKSFRLPTFPAVVTVACHSWEEFADLFGAVVQGEAIVTATTEAMAGQNLLVRVAMPSLGDLDFEGTLEAKRGEHVRIKFRALSPQDIAGIRRMMLLAGSSPSTLAASPAAGTPARAVPSGHVTRDAALCSTTPNRVDPAGPASGVSQNREVLAPSISEEGVGEAPPVDPELERVLTKLRAELSRLVSSTDEQILELDWSATPKEVRAAFMRLSRFHHPDRFARFGPGLIREYSHRVFMRIELAHRNMLTRAQAAAREAAILAEQQTNSVPIAPDPSTPPTSGPSSNPSPRTIPSRPSSGAPPSREPSTPADPRQRRAELAEIMRRATPSAAQKLPGVKAAAPATGGVSNLPPPLKEEMQKARMVRQLWDQALVHRKLKEYEDYVNTLRQILSLMPGHEGALTALRAARSKQIQRPLIDQEEDRAPDSGMFSRLLDTLRGK